jgi:hypothetical protein
LQERLLFFYKLKSEDLPLKNQIKSNQNRIDRSIVRYFYLGGRRSEVNFLGCFSGGLGGARRGEISSIIAAAISISVSIETEL